MSVNPIPKGYNTLTPFLVVTNGAEIIEFLKNAFEAEEMYRMTGPDNGIMHAELKLGNSMIMIGEAMADNKPWPNMLYFYTKDVDSVYQKALDAGAKSVNEPANHYYGDRNAGVMDPAGNMWWIATHIEDVTPEQIKKRVELSSEVV